MLTKKIKYSAHLLLLTLLSGVIVCIAAYAATPPTDVLEPAVPLFGSTEEKTQTFEYILEGRPDPFVPFITKKASTPKLNPDEIIDEDVELTGMRQFEPGQLTLVAVLETSNNKIAMVEDVTGKGYMLNKGTPIGRHGVVSRITLQQVVVTETAHTRAGKEIKNTIVMRLNKEGEQ
jgi:type IV pilus assembly protein PilP